MIPKLASERSVKELFREYGLYPSKKLGQNFLLDSSAVKKFLKAAELGLKDTILEIGPGVGNLTKELAKRVKRVVAIEKDPRFVRILNDELRIKNIKNVEIIEGDILKIPHSAFNIQHSYKVVGNLPFYLTAPVIRRFLELTKDRPSLMTLIVQKEVAQRIVARPPRMTRSTGSGSSRAGRGMNPLAILVQFYAKPEIISYISKNSFWPQPKVDGAILKIAPYRAAPHQYLRYGTGLREQFFKIVRSGFSHPRKQVLNNLSEVLKLEKEKVKSWLLTNGVQPEQRAETLTIRDWISLTKNFNAFK